MKLSVSILINFLVYFALVTSYKLVRSYCNTLTINDRVSRLMSMNSKEEPPLQRTFASYSIYKGKAALTAKVIPSTFTNISPQSRIISREGGLLFEFAPSGSTLREYDWTKKTTFLLDASELGEVLVMEKSKSNSVEFVHDPNALTDKAGQINKKLKITPLNDGNGYFISLQVNDKGANGPVSYSLPVTHGELQVLKSIMGYIIPYILGFNEVWNNPAMSELAPEPIPVPSPAPAWKRTA